MSIAFGMTFHRHLSFLFISASWTSTPTRTRTRRSKKKTRVRSKTSSGTGTTHRRQTRLRPSRRLRRWKRRQATGRWRTSRWSRWRRNVKRRCRWSTWRSGIRQPSLRRRKERLSGTENLRPRFPPELSSSTSCLRRLVERNRSLRSRHRIGLMLIQSASVVSDRECVSENNKSLNVEKVLVLCIEKLYLQQENVDKLLYKYFVWWWCSHISGKLNCLKLEIRLRKLETKISKSFDKLYLNMLWDSFYSYLFYCKPNN